MDLDDDRQMSVDGACALPWTAIAQYAQFYELNEEQKEDLFFLVRRMDRARLLEMEKKKPKPPGNVKKPSQRNK